MIQENSPLIQTQRLILRKFTQDDMTDILLIYGDEEVNTFLPWFPVRNIEQAREFFEQRIFSDYANETAYRYAIALKTDNRAIGYINISGVGQSNDLGYGLRKEFWHSGITTEAGIGVLDRLRQVGFPYVTATHDIHNPHSGAVMKKIGLTYRYSYKELCQPKNTMVTFRMFQLNLDGVARTYTEYQKKYPHFIEANI